MKQEVKQAITMHCVDDKGIAKPSSILAYMQDAANTQMHIYGPSNEELWAIGQAFILSKISINYNAPLRNYEEIISRSWAMPSQGYTYNRALTLWRGDECVADAWSEWALVDSVNKRFIKVCDFKDNYGTDEPLEKNKYNLRPKILTPDSLTYLGKFMVTYTDTDQNHHMNNTKYPDMICNFVDMTHRVMRKISISFINEAIKGESLEAFGYFDKDGIFYFRSVRPDSKTNIEAVVEFSEYYQK